MTGRLIINLDPHSKMPLYRQIASECKSLIVSGILVHGTKLPSIREFAQQLKVSVLTIREAIGELLSEDLVVSKHGSGIYANDRNWTPTAKHTQPPAKIEFAPAYPSWSLELAEGIQWSRQARELAAAFNRMPFGAWWDTPATFDLRMIQRLPDVKHKQRLDKSIIEKMSHDINVFTGYQDPRGLAALRELVSDWLNRTRRLNCRPEDLFIVSGAQQARDLVSEILLKRNDGVVVEEPGSITDMLAYSSKGARIHHVNQDSGGLIVEELETIHDAQIAHIISSSNFPTAAVLSSQRRNTLLAWAARHNVTVVEDSFGAEFQYVATVPDAMYATALETDVKVIYVGSLSHIIAPSLRLGYVLVPPEFHSSFIAAKWLADHHSSAIAQQMALAFLSEPLFDEHLLKYIQVVRVRRDALVDELSRWPRELITFKPIETGFQQPIWFADEIDDLFVAEEASKLGVRASPLSRYFHASAPRSGLSLNFLGLDEQQLAQASQILLDVTRRCADLGSLS